MNDVVFAIDPGSLRTGWAVLQAPERLVEAGLLLPDKTTAPSEFRINSMCRDLWLLLNEHRPKVILVEWTSGKLNARRHQGSGQGLAVHGAATGALWRECLAWRRSPRAKQQLEVKVILVRENDWTRGVPKQDRIRAVANMFPIYKPTNDGGGDIADAIALSVWYLHERIVRLAECIA